MRYMSKIRYEPDITPLLLLLLTPFSPVAVPAENGTSGKRSTMHIHSAHPCFPRFRCGPFFQTPPVEPFLVSRFPAPASLFTRSSSSTRVFRADIIAYDWRSCGSNGEA